jgi:hypothetical protein
VITNLAPSLVVPPSGGGAFDFAEMLLSWLWLFIQGLPLSLIYWLIETRYYKVMA